LRRDFPVATLSTVSAKNRQTNLNFDPDILDNQVRRNPPSNPLFPPEFSVDMFFPKYAAKA
jgi:hypothetical protein